MQGAQDGLLLGKRVVLRQPLKACLHSIHEAEASHEGGPTEGKSGHEEEAARAQISLVLTGRAHCCLLSFGELLDQAHTTDMCVTLWHSSLHALLMCSDCFEQHKFSAVHPNLPSWQKFNGLEYFVRPELCAACSFAGQLRLTVSVNHSSPEPQNSFNVDTALLRRLSNACFMHSGYRMEPVALTCRVVEICYISQSKS